MRGETKKSGKRNYSDIVPLLIETWNCNSQDTFVVFVGNNWNKGGEKNQFLFHCNLGTDKGKCDVAEGAEVRSVSIRLIYVLEEVTMGET